MRSETWKNAAMIVIKKRLNMQACRTFVCSMLTCLTVVLSFATAAAQDQPAFPERRIPEPLKVYMGRTIAVTMHYTGAEWLIRNEREREERCSMVLTNLGVKPGMKVCDMGCGNGFYTLQIAQMVGPQGHVYAVDIQPEMLKMLNFRADQEGVANFSPILGSELDPRLPKESVDMILCVDVCHEFSYPEQMLAAMRQALAPDGVIVLVEFRAEDPKVPIKPEHKMTKAQVLKEMKPNGFKLVKEFEKLPWQHMMFFGKDEDFVPPQPRGGRNTSR